MPTTTLPSGQVWESGSYANALFAEVVEQNNTTGRVHTDTGYYTDRPFSYDGYAKCQNAGRTKISVSMQSFSNVAYAGSYVNLEIYNNGGLIKTFKVASFLTKDGDSITDIPKSVTESFVVDGQIEIRYSTGSDAHNAPAEMTVWFEHEVSVPITPIDSTTSPIPPSDSTTTPMPTQELWQLDLRTLGGVNPNLSSSVVQTLRSACSAAGWNLINIYPTTDGYHIDLEKTGSVLLATLIGIIAVVLAIVVISWTATRLSDNAVQTQAINSTNDAISSVLSDPELTTEEKISLIDSIKSVYSTNNDDDGGFLGETTQLVQLAVLGMLALAVAKATK